ncbi:glycerol kinase GlpK [Schlesneria sp.]|uniref:glycerol kinase GlpK n=1 Tax=Schlesneria sp. TaxID=2762018 RepID=UPI002EE62996
MPYVLALDAGTTSCRALIFDETGSVCQIAQREFRQHYPQPGWVEHNAHDIWETQLSVARQAIEQQGIHARDLAAVGITNQRETTIVWDRKTGQPICPAIVWQDRRTAPMCDRLRRDGVEGLVTERTGLVLDAYFSATKIAWILDNVPGAREQAAAGKLAFGTVDSWLIWNLTKGKSHLTDVTNASRTQLFNIHTRQWDAELLSLFGIPRAMLPDVCESSGQLAEVAAEQFGAPIPIAGIAGDQQAALFGQLCVHRGETKTTYGTGCFMLQHTGDTPVASHSRLITTIAAAPAGQVAYALEGSVFIGGAVVQWLRDGLRAIVSSEEIRDLAGSVPDSGGVCFVPAFAGLGAPYWDANARGMIIGLTQGTTVAHIARAAVESIAHQVADLAAAMQSDSGVTLPEMKVDGGATRDDLLLQFQSDLLQVPLVRPAVTETTARGAAFLAGLAAGVWTDVSQLATLEQIDRRFEPRMDQAVVTRARERWKKAVSRCKNWEGDE